MLEPSATMAPTLPPTLPPTLSAEKAEQILAGAARIFADAGYEGASMSRIAAEAGVSKGTLYNYFAGKRELFTAFVQLVCARRIALIFGAWDSAAPPRDALARICHQMLRMLVSPEGTLMYRMVVSEAANFPELAEVFYTAGPLRCTGRLGDVIRHYADAGILTVADPGFAAEQLFGLMQTRLLMHRRLNMATEPTEAEIERVVDAGVGLFLRGYAACAAA